jgi:hypothetical protein
MSDRPLSVGPFDGARSAYTALGEGLLMAEAAPMPTVWRLHLRSQDPAVDHAEQVDYCVSRRIGAVGWPLDGPGPARLAECLERTRERWGSRPAGVIRRLGQDAQLGDLVWARETDGSYLLGAVCGQWRYDASQQARAVDCHNVRPISWAPRRLLDAVVPGDVIRAFSAQGSTFQRVNQRAAVISQRLYDQTCGRDSDVQLPSAFEVLTEHLAPYDVEDLVYTYLQARREYLVLPASRRTDTAAYEYVLVHRPTGRLAICQVKTGSAGVNVNELARAARDSDADAFAYSTAGRYDGDPDGIVELITDSQLLEFADADPRLLPPRVRTWMDR